MTNNYVYFNCKNVENQTRDTCELYRIIRIFPTDDGTGKIENRIKLVKENSYGKYEWNKNKTNNWAELTTLNNKLNTTYWNSIKKEYQELIGNTKYYLGGYVNREVTVDSIYKYERKIKGKSYYNKNNPNSWIGKIAIMYASDYAYGAEKSCTKSLAHYNTKDCYKKKTGYI